MAVCFPFAFQYPLPGTARQWGMPSSCSPSPAEASFPWSAGNGDSYFVELSNLLLLLLIFISVTRGGERRMEIGFLSRAKL